MDSERIIGQYLIKQINSGRSKLSIKDISSELCIPIETVKISFLEYPPLNILYSGIDDPKIKNAIAGKNIDAIFKEILTLERIRQIKADIKKKRYEPPNDIA